MLQTILYNSLQVNTQWFLAFHYFKDNPHVTCIYTNFFWILWSICPTFKGIWCDTFYIAPTPVGVLKQRKGVKIWIVRNLSALCCTIHLKNSSSNWFIYPSWEHGKNLCHQGPGEPPFGDVIFLQFRTSQGLVSLNCCCKPSYLQPIVSIFAIFRSTKNLRCFIGTHFSHEIEVEAFFFGLEIKS